MPARLLVLLPSREGAIGEFRLVDPAVATLELPAAGLLPDLPKADPPYPAQVFVPAEQVGLHLATLPTRNVRQVRRAVPFVLEDQLAESVDNLHFALGPAGTGTERSVAVVSRAQMESWLDALTAAGIRAQELTPDVLALPLEDEGWTLYLGAERALLRKGRVDGFACELENLPLLLQAALEEAGEDGPPRITVYREGDADGPADLPPGPEYHTRPCPEGLLSVLGRARSELNLLQGPFELAAPWKRQLSQWRFAAALAAAWILVIGAGALVEGMRLHAQATQLEAANRQLFFEVLPDTSRYVAARSRIQRRLDELESGERDSGLFVILAQAAEALAAHPELTLEQLQFRAGNLDLNLLAKDTQILEELIQRLRDNALEAQLVSASRDGDQVRGRLRVSGGVGA
jgi:general secretion pathway protein L